MRILWICGLPQAVRETLGDEFHGPPIHAQSWIVSHLPPVSGIDLHIACLWPGGSARKSVSFEGATIHLLPCPRRGRALLLFQRDQSYFRKLFEELNPDVVHGWGTEDSFGLVARQLAPRRHVIGIQGLINACRARGPLPKRTILTALGERWTLGRARTIVAESRYAIEAVRPLCPRAEFRVIEHPIRKEFLQSEPADGRHTRMLFVGTISEMKGISDALRAFSSIEEPKWDLHIVGSGDLGAETRMLGLADELGIRGRIRHDHNLSSREIAAAMQNSSVFLLPTRIDTGPTALKEALALGLWPVCYDNSGPGEYVRQFSYGTLGRDLDLKDLTAKLREAIRSCPWLDPSRRATLRNSTRIAFSRERIWGELSQLYREISLQT